MKLRVGKDLASSGINVYQVMVIGFSTYDFTVLNENRTLIQLLKFVVLLILG